MSFVVAASVIAAVPTVAAPPPESDGRNDRRPNVVFLFADDWGRHASVYAERPLCPDGPIDPLCEIVETPNIDSVARRGVTFTRAFVGSPSCTPCRSSLMSGRHFWQTGRASILINARWDGTIPTWPERLRQSGYHIGLTHKAWSPGEPKDAMYGGDRSQYRPAGGMDNHFGQDAMRMIRRGRAVDEVRATFRDRVRRNFTAFLDDRNDDSRPFHYFYGPMNVHRKYEPGSGRALWNLDPDDLRGRMPPYLPDVVTVREDLTDYVGEVMAFDTAVGVIVDEIRSRGLTDQTVVIISGDHGPPGFPHGKCNLYDFGTSVALIVAGPDVRTGEWADDPVCLPQLCPTILEMTGADPIEGLPNRSLVDVLTVGGQTESSDTPVDGTDVPKNGSDVEPDNGQDVDPRTAPAVFFGRERHVGNARADYRPYPQRAIRTSDHLFIINFRSDRWPLGDPYRLNGDNPPTFDEVARDTRVTVPDEDAGPTKAAIITGRDAPEMRPFFQHAYGKRPGEELYDLRRDPHQMRNVVAADGYADTADVLRRRLMDELRRTDDPRLVDGGQFFETPPMTDVPEKYRR